VCVRVCARARARMHVLSLIQKTASQQSGKLCWCTGTSLSGWRVEYYLIWNSAWISTTVAELKKQVTFSKFSGHLE